MLTYDGLLSRADAGVLVLFLIIFIYYIFRAGNVEDQHVSSIGTKKTILYILAGIALLVVGGKRVVDGAIALAQLFGMTERVI